MTPAQIALMKKCYAGWDAMMEEREHRYAYVEVGWINGVNPRTAKALVEMGLLEEDMPPWANELTNTHVRLPMKLPRF